MLNSRYLRLILLVILGWLATDVARAASAIRFLANTPAEASTASSFGLIAELYDTVTNQRLVVSGVTVNLGLYRCPGYPSSCSVVIVDSSFASANSVNGLVAFTSLGIDTANPDYYFFASSAGYTGVTSNVFDVVQARAFISGVPGGAISTASRMPVQVTIRRGPSASDPIDTLADGVNIRLGFYACPGYPSSCSVVILNSNFANAVSNNGVANFGLLNISTAGDDRYFATSNTNGLNITNSTSSVFDVVQASAHISGVPGGQISAASQLPVQVTIHRGPTTSDPVDTLADGIGMRLGLYACPGYPSSCSVVILNSNFANAVATDGVANFGLLGVDSVGEDRYFATSNTSGLTISNTTSNVFDVVTSYLRLEVQPAPPVSTASRLDYQAVFRIGPGVNAPIDTAVDDVNVRLGLYSCPGYPASCSVVILNTNFANAVANDGVANFNDLVLNTVGEDRYFFVTAPGLAGVSGSTSAVFDVVQGVLRVEMIPGQVYAGQSFNVTARIRAGTLPGDPIDVHADNINVRLRLFSCVGYPMACTPAELTSNFANALSSDGVSSFSNLVIATAGPDRYFVPATPATTGINLQPGSVFDVLAWSQTIFQDSFENP